MADRPKTPADLPYRRGVGMLLTDGRGRIFVARRIDMPDAWQMPQGGIDKGESPTKAALRELKEEIGTDRARILAKTAGWIRYDLPAHLVGKALRGRYRGQEQMWFALLFTGSDADIDLAAHEREFDAWRWAEPAEVLAGIAAFKRPVYRQVLAEFAPILEAQRTAPADGAP